MRERAKQLIKHPLIYGSSIVVIGNLVANFFNFLFNIFMNKHLSVADYGVLLSIMSLIAFPALIGTAIIPVVVRFAGSYFAKNNFSLLRAYKNAADRVILLYFPIPHVPSFSSK